jgi:hypothetical protein
MFKEWNKVPGLDKCLQDVIDPKTGAVTQVATLSCIPAIFLNLVSALLAFTGLIALVMFLAGSLKFMNASGDPKKLEGAKNSFSFAIIGLVIVLFSFLIIQVISTVTGVECITKFGFGCK